MIYVASLVFHVGAYHLLDFFISEKTRKATHLGFYALYMSHGNGTDQSY